MCNKLDKTLAALSRASGEDTQGLGGYLAALDALQKVAQNLDTEMCAANPVPFSDPDAFFKRQAN